MSPFNGSPLSPASWQAGGEQGAGAATWDRCRREANRLPDTARLLVAWHIDAARSLLLAYAARTDSPEWEAVDAADSLEAAADSLTARARDTWSTP